MMNKKHTIILLAILSLPLLLFTYFKIVWLLAGFFFEENQHFASFIGSLVSVIIGALYTVFTVFHDDIK